jgi:hypothetical protein
MKNKNSKYKKIMKARFLQNVLIDDGKYSMFIDKGEIIDAIDRGAYYELRRESGWGTKTKIPKGAVGIICEII